MTITNRITLNKGCNQTFLLTVTSGGAAVDLVDAKITFVACQTAKSTPVIVRKTANQPGGSDDQIKILAPTTDGKAEIYFVPENTIGEKSGDNYVYEVKIKFPNDVVLPAIAPSMLVISESVIEEFDMEDLYSGQIVAVLAPSAVYSVSE